MFKKGVTKVSTKELCSRLMKTDSEEEIIQILKEQKLWDNPNAWRYYGDKENNYSAAGNQADEAEAALMEKITNSRDAILMNACMERGIDPKGKDAPGSISAAVAQFFEKYPDKEYAGHVKEWDAKKRREIAKKLSVFITGSRPKKSSFPSINISDLGEGQSPDRMTETILSLGESIKREIKFVHGKWNMGGTAALVYCGKKNLQLVISKRNPKLITEKDGPRYDEWGFTIVRREDPVGNETSSAYTYLAPVGIEDNPRKGSVLSFSSKTFPIFADGNKGYSREVEWGTLVKLYEYQTSYYESVEQRRGLLRPIDLLVPDLGLPFRLHECRVEGDPKSFEHQINGLNVRLFDNKGKSLENNYPTTKKTFIRGQEFVITVYAFKDKKAMTYRQSDKGIVFTLNGQSQGWLDDRFFIRNQVSLGYLRKSLFVVVDCSNLEYRAQEEFFVNNRVHIRKGPFRDQVEEEIMDYLRNHHGLKELQSERQRKLKEDKISDDKPLESILSRVIKNSNTFSRIFLKGQRLSSPFKSKPSKPKIDFDGEKHPTFFRFNKQDYGEILERTAMRSKKCRIQFRTDAENNYFSRKINPGEYKLYFENNDGKYIFAENEKIDYSLNLYNGSATLNVNIDEKFDLYSEYKFKLVVKDPVLILDGLFENEFVLSITPYVKSRTGAIRLE